MRKITLTAIALALAGCGMFKPRPPAFSLYERQRLVVLPFENLTHDPALARTVEDGVIQGLVQLKACPVASQDAVAAQIKKLGVGVAGLEGDAKSRKEIAQMFKCDTIMVGTVNAYTESMAEQEPQRKKLRDGTFKWGYADVSAVTTSANVKIIDANTGNILWANSKRGSGETHRWVDLPYEGSKSEPPAEGWKSYRAGLAKGKDKKVPPGHAKKGTLPPGQAKKQGEAPPGQQAQLPQGQTINIIIQQNQQATQTQQQEQTQTQAQAQTQTAPAAEAKPQLLYRTDHSVARAREAAIARITSSILSDYRGAYGWKPGMPAE